MKKSTARKSWGMTAAIFLENEELKEICQQTVTKLEQMTDEEFDAIDFTIYDEEDLDGEM